MSAVPEHVSGQVSGVEEFPVVGKDYYVAGAGIATHQIKYDPLTGDDMSNLPKQFKKTSGAVYRLKHDSVYSGQEGMVYVAHSEVMQHHRLHELPSAEELIAILRVLPQDTQIPSAKNNDTLRNHFLWQMNNEGLKGLAGVIRDSKVLFKGGLHESAQRVLANVLAHHMKSLPSEAFDYVQIVTATSRWPHWLPLLPENRETMKAVTAQRQRRDGFSPEWYASVGGKPLGGVLPSAPAPASAGHKTIGVLTPAPAPRATAAKAPAAPEDFKVRFVRADTIEANAPFTRETRIYKQLMASVATPLERKIVMAAVDRATQAEMLELSRLLLSATPELNAYRFAEEYRAVEATKTWSCDDVRTHYAQMLGKWLRQMQEDGNLAEVDKVGAQGLYKRIHKSRSLPDDIVFGLPSAAAPAPAVEQDNAAPVEPVRAFSDAAANEERAVVEPAAPAPVDPPAPPTLTTPVATEAETMTQPAPVTTIGDETVTSQVVFQLRRQPNNWFPTGVNEEIDHLRHEVPENQQAVALAGLASAVLSPVAFSVFSGVALRSEKSRLTLDTVAKTLGVDRDAAVAIFNGAAKIVHESAVKLASDPAFIPR